jgi:hypothetical protein
VLGAEAVFTGFAVPEDAGLLAGDGAVDLSVFGEGDVVAPLDAAVLVQDLVEPADGDAVVAVEVVDVLLRLALGDGEDDFGTPARGRRRWAKARR